MVSMNGGIMTVIETYIARLTETNSMNGGIMTLLEIGITNITKHDSEKTMRYFFMNKVDSMILLCWM